MIEWLILPILSNNVQANLLNPAGNLVLRQLPQPKIIGDRQLPSNKIIESPRSTWLTEINDILHKDRIIAPPLDKSKPDKMEAARLIVIRRRKMKKHKLKKLRRKMKFEWAKVRQRREMRKEKAFQATLLAQIKQAESFSAEQYVAETLRQANEVPLPRYWKGKRLPAFIIKQKLGIK